jgi:hypothetical protein
MPKLIEAIDNELHRFNFRNVINTVESFHQLFKQQSEIKILKEDGLADIHRMLNRYLVDTLSQSKKDITGYEFTKLI